MVALAIPGADIEAVYTDGRQLDDAWFNVPDGHNIVRWVPGELPPEKANVALRLTKELSTRELTARWKKLAVILPFVASILVALISVLDPAGWRPARVSEWTIKGSVTPPPGLTDVRLLVAPPRSFVLSDGNFTSSVWVEDGNDVDLVLEPLGMSDYKPAVVYLQTPGRDMPFNAKHYAQQLDVEGHTIDHPGADRIRAAGRRRLLQPSRYASTKMRLV